MKELKNLVTVTGKLVKNNIDEFTTKKGEEAIGGSLVLRTADDSEHECIREPGCHFLQYIPVCIV